MIVVMLGLLASGALEKPDGSKLRIRDVYLWAFGYPADDPLVTHAAAKPIAISEAPDVPPPPVVEPVKPPPLPQPPKDQVQFTSLVTKFAVPSGSAPNQAAQRKMRTDRAAALCQQMKERTVIDWVGTVQDRGRDASGNGFLYIDLGGVQVGTAGSVAADGTNRTMVLRDSVLSTIVDRLNTGQTVLFTGDLFSDRGDCLKQSNATAPDAVTKPRYLMKIVNLKGF